MLEGTRAEKGREKEEQTVEEEKVVAYRKIIEFYDRNESTGMKEYKNPAFCPN